MKNIVGFTFVLLFVYSMVSCSKQEKIEQERPNILFIMLFIFSFFIPKIIKKVKGDETVRRPEENLYKPEVE